MHEQKAYSHSFPPDNNLDTWTPIILFTTEKNPYCKVIRIGKRVQPDISKARQQVKI